MERRIALVEDNLAASETFGLALARLDPDIELMVLEDGARAIDYFSALKDRRAAPCDLILLDINLPYVCGFEILEFLKGDDELKKIPVVMLSGSGSQNDIERAYESGANSYICKPAGIENVFGMITHLVSYWFEQSRRPVWAGFTSHDAPQSAF